MDPGFSVPIVAIIGAFCLAFYRMHMRHLERMSMMRGSNQVPTSNASQETLDMLREDVARLRDTSTQHAMSLQNAMEEMQHRLDMVEAKTRSLPAPSPMEQNNQPVGVGRN